MSQVYYYIYTAVTSILHHKCVTTISVSHELEFTMNISMPQVLLSHDLCNCQSTAASPVFTDHCPYKCSSNSSTSADLLVSSA